MPFLKPDRSPIIRHPQGHPVAVIASYKADGDFIPMRFCVEDDYEELFKYEISAIKAIKDRHGVKIFHCVYVSNGYRNDIALCCDINLHRWVIE